MARVRVCVLGPAGLEVDGEPVRLTPLTVRLLLRLVAARGESVRVRRLYQDVWGVQDGDGPRGKALSLRDRNEVQKRILELRQALKSPDAVRTGEVAVPGGKETTYQLVLDPDELDCSRFADLVRDGMHAAPATAARMLAEAVALVRGRPLAEVDGEEFAAALVRWVTDSYEAARRELVRVRLDLGRVQEALDIAEQMAADHPGDAAIAESLAAIRDRLRRRHGDEILRHELPDLRTAVVVARGDLFDQADANLVVGFSDTFDVATAEDFVISRDSVQGQLVDRLFGGDPKALDRELRRGLRDAVVVRVEDPKDKRRGKRVRYPLGTTVPIPIGGRRVFAVAYSYLGNDLVARSGPEDLRQSLDALWDAAARHSLRKPVAVPLVGSGLARIVGIGPDRLLATVAETFVAAFRRHPMVAPELRIVIRPADLEKTGLAALEQFLAGESPHIAVSDP